MKLILIAILSLALSALLCYGAMMIAESIARGEKARADQAVMDSTI